MSRTNTIVNTLQVIAGGVMLSTITAAILSVGGLGYTIVRSEYHNFRSQRIIRRIKINYPDQVYRKFNKETMDLWLETTLYRGEAVCIVYDKWVKDGVITENTVSWFDRGDRA